VRQGSLLGLGDPSFDRRALGRHPDQLGLGAWILHLPAWLEGHEEVFDEVLASTAWRAEERPMYERVVAVPRLTARIPTDGPGHPVLLAVASALGQALGRPFDSIALAWYRDGSDSVAPHGDQVVRHLPTSVMATLSLGTPRRFRLTPRSPGPAPWSADLGHGDLLVMGGTIQRTWSHAVPKTTRPVGPRVSVMFRTPGLG